VVFYKTQNRLVLCRQLTYRHVLFLSVFEGAKKTDSHLLQYGAGIYLNKQQRKLVISKILHIRSN
jgi:hypothetical protein